MAAAHSTVLRRENRFDEALEFARRAAATASQTDDFVARFTALRGYARALICTPESHRAREPLVELLRLRHSAVGDVRFEVRLLLGDYRVAAARRELGLPVVDLEFGSPAEGAWVAPHRSRSVRHLRLARRAYRWAQRAADAVDALLDCDIRSRRIAVRSAFDEH